MKHHGFFDWATQGYLLLVAVLIAFFHNATVPNWRCLAAAHVVAAALIEAVIRAETRRPGCRVLSFLRHFYPILLYAGLYAEIGLINRLFFPNYLDVVVIHWERRWFGCQPSVEFMRALPYLLVSEVMYAAYFSYYVMIGGVGLALFLTNRQKFCHYVSVVSFVFYGCYLVFLLFPIAGPMFVFPPAAGLPVPEDLRAIAQTQLYPEAIRVGPFFNLMAWIYRGFDSPGAALPSSHVAVAWWTVFFSFRYLRPIRYPHLATTLLLCLATVYCRYHYLVDSIAGLAAAAVLVPLGNGLYLRLAMSQAASDRADTFCKAARLLPPEAGAS